MPAVPVRARASQRTEWKRFLVRTTARAEPTRTTARAAKAIGSRLTRPLRRGLAGGAFGLGRPGRRLHVAEHVAGRPRGLELQPERVEAVLVEQQLAPVGGRQVERLHHDDGVGRAHLHAQLAELAGVQLEGEGLGVVPLLRLEHLHLDDLRRADVLAEPAADAVLLARLLVVDEREHAAEAVGILARDVGVVHGDRLAHEVDERDAHGLDAPPGPGRHLAREPPRPASGATGAPPGHPRRRRHQQQQGGGQQELPRDGEDLVHPDAHEAPAHPRDEEEDRASP